MYTRLHTHTQIHTSTYYVLLANAIAVYGVMQTLVIIKITADTSASATDAVVAAVQLNNK